MTDAMRNAATALLRGGALVVLLVAFLAGCRSEEQDRVIDFDPGVYKGEEDSGLSPEEYEELRSRARLQAGP